MVQKFSGKVPESLEIAKFPKSKSFNQKFCKFKNENQMEEKFPGNFFSEIFLCIPRKVVPFLYHVNSQFSIHW